MKLTTKGRYAVTAMLDLSLHYHDGPVSLADIAQRQCISLSYLEQLFTRLRKRGLVRSTRGPGGGYALSHAPSEIAIADVIAAVDEKTDSTRCGGALNCHNEQRCLTHTLWEALNLQIHEFLSKISLAELMSREEIMEVAMRQDRALKWKHSRLRTRTRDQAGA